MKIKYEVDINSGEGDCGGISLELYEDVFIMSEYYNVFKFQIKTENEKNTVINFIKFINQTNDNN